jgi:hypothetical protein
MTPTPLPAISFAAGADSTTYAKHQKQIDAAMDTLVIP